MTSKPVAAAIRQPQELIQNILDGKAEVFHAENAGAAQESTEKLSLGGAFYKHLMSGVSQMLPFVIGGGIMIALAFLLDQIMGVPKDQLSQLGSYHEIAAQFKAIGGAAFGFMLHVRGCHKQKYSEACRPILGKHTDGLAGRIIDLLAVFALLAGTATTFSVATPLMATIIGEFFHITVSRTVINIIILLITCAVYTYSLLHGFKGISKLANICIYMFFGLIAFVLLFGGETRYIIETGFSSLGRMMQNFIDLSTFTDPLRTSNFPQNWTIYYWAYWMVWCVAAPFFIGSISRGRTVRQTILGGYVFGVGSTLTSFIVLGNYSMGMQVTEKADFIKQYLDNGDLYGMIVSIIKTLPCAPVIMVIVLLTMIAFYATSFDSIALTASCYSYHTLEDGEQPNKGIQLMWCILLILLPIALLFAESSMSNLQSVSIVAAFPIGAVIVMIALSFLKDAKKYLQEMKNE